MCKAGVQCEVNDDSQQIPEFLIPLVSQELSADSVDTKGTFELRKTPIRRESDNEVEFLLSKSIAF